MSKPEAVIGVCLGPRCSDYGGRALAAQLNTAGMETAALDCQSLCAYSPVACKAGRIIHRASIEKTAA